MPQDIIQVLTQALYVVVFVLTAWAAVRHPRPITVETGLLFGAAAASVALSWLFTLEGEQPPKLAMDFSTAFALLIPYLLLRLVDEFAGVPWFIQRAAEAWLVACVALRFASPGQPPLWTTLLLVGYFASVTLYVTWAFAAGARSSVGSTARRMGAVAIGSGLLSGAVLVTGLQLLVPSIVIGIGVLGGPLGLASGLAFYLGFTTPQWLLRMWRQPELTDFMEHMGELAEQSDVVGLLAQLQIAVSRALGLRGGFVGLWNEDMRVLEYNATHISTVPDVPVDPSFRIEDGLLRTPSDALVAGKAFSEQRPLYVEKVEEIDTEHAGLYKALGVKAVIAAPMTLGTERFGVLGVFAPRPRLFGEESLARVQGLARHTAYMLRTRRLLEKAVTVRAHEEVARLKDEFLSSATHNLKTPLTGIKGIAQLAGRRASRPNASDDALDLVKDFKHIQEAADRMATLIDEMLDVSRLQMARPLEYVRSSVDLVSLASRVAERHSPVSSVHRIRCVADGPVVGVWDGARLERVIDNLVSNAVKFSPRGGEVVIAVEAHGDTAMLSVSDEGIGLHPEETARVFERFERGSNAVEHGITGTGIGLAYVREVVSGHDGEVHIESQPGVGSVVTVRLPLEAVGAAGADTKNCSEKYVEVV